MMQFDAEFMANYHMTPACFAVLFQRIEKHLLPKRNTRPFDGIPPKHRLAMVLE